MSYRIHWWADIHRSAAANLRLGCALCVVAGATNAGGFLAVGQYTSHMSGILSSVADNLVLGQLQLAAAGLATCHSLPFLDEHFLQRNLLSGRISASGFSSPHDLHFIGQLSIW